MVQKIEKLANKRDPSNRKNIMKSILSQIQYFSLAQQTWYVSPLTL